MTAVLASLQLQLVCHWIVPGNHSVINGNNYSPADYSLPLPAFPHLGQKYGGYNEKSADPESRADQNRNGSAEKRSPTIDLPKGYVPFSQHRAAYKIHEELATWNEARERCIAEGGYLAIIDSRDKIASIRSMNNQSDNWLHVGIHNSVDSNQWVRVDNGLAVTSVPWAYEDSKLAGSCAGISLFRFGLLNYLCSRKREHFVCEISITGGHHLVDSSTEVNEITPAPTSPTATLPEGHVRFVYGRTTPSTTPRPSSTTGIVPKDYQKFPEDRAAYKIHYVTKPWYEARDTCISEGARLAITDSREKVNHILNLTSYRSDVWLHVGIHKPENGDEWVRVDNGSPVSSLPWSDGFPDHTQDSCVLISLANGLANHDCLWYRPFVCEIPDSDGDNSERSATETHSKTSPTPLPAATLPEDYVTISEDHAAYKIHHERKSWYEARDTCISEGARLAIADSWEKIEHILSIPTVMAYMFLHVGIHKPENGDEWVRVDDGLPVSSIPWSLGYPDQDSCAVIYLRSGLVNYGCSLHTQFVCEIPDSEEDNSERSTTEGEPAEWMKNISHPLRADADTTSTTPSPTLLRSYETFEAQNATIDEIGARNQSRDYPGEEEFEHHLANGTTSPPPSPAATLPEGYVRFSEDRAAFKIHRVLKSWYQARDTCISEGARLAITDSREKIQHILSLHTYGIYDWLNVGIYRPENGDEWVRVDDGLPVSFIPWSPGFPDRSQDSCALIHSQNGLANYACLGSRAFVCEIPDSDEDKSEQSTTKVVDTTPVPTSTTATDPEDYVTVPGENNETTNQPSDDYDEDESTTHDGVVDITWLEPPSTTATLPGGYVRFPEDRAAYKIHQEKKSWKDARDTCISEGARLAITDSREKIQHIRSLPTFLYRLYVGIYKPENGTEWVRVDDGLPVSSIPWYSRSPDTTQHGCALVFARNGLANYGCLLDQPFVCEIPDSEEDNSKQSPPEGYVRIWEDRAYYKIHAEYKSWIEARDICISEGARLAIIDSRQKMQHVQLLPAYEDEAIDFLWAGIHKSKDSGKWVRVDDGSPVSSIPWSLMSPDTIDHSSDSCVVIFAVTGGFYHIGCSSATAHFVCEIPIPDDDNSEQSSTEAVSMASTPPSPAATLPEGYVRFSEDRAAYKIHFEKESWYDARDTCISEGARLAITDSREKLNHIQSLPTYRTYMWLLVGIYMPENGADEWVRVDDGSPVPSSIPWWEGFPDGEVTDRCAQLSIERGGLSNYPCSLSESFVCEIPISDDDNGKEHGE